MVIRQESLAVSRVKTNEMWKATRRGRAMIDALVAVENKDHVAGFSRQNVTLKLDFPNQCDYDIIIWSLIPSFRRPTLRA